MRNRPLLKLAAACLLGALIAFQSPARGKPGQKELEELLADTDKIAAKVSKIRGLEVKKPIARGVMSRGPALKKDSLVLP